VIDPDGKPLLLVETKRHTIDQSGLKQLEEYAASLRPAFVMIADVREIKVAPAYNGVPDWSHVIQLPTSATLGHYTETPNFGHIEGFYLESLVEAWLRDFTQPWKFPQPPGYRELESMGLTSRLRGGEIRFEVQA